MKNIKNTHAFTLVELIIVITILGILATIGFMSYQGYGMNSRDAVRLSDMGNIEKGLKVIASKGEMVPMPDNSVDITASGTILIHQGYAGRETLKDIGIKGSGVDPLDGSEYTYATNLARNQVQILGYLEQEQLSFTNTSYADFTDRYAKVSGDEVGIFVDPATNNPAQINGSDIDVEVTTDEYNVIFGNNLENLSGTSEQLIGIKNIYNYGEKASCLDLLNSYPELSGEDGIYTIVPYNTVLNVYCDMTTDSGGWTLVFNQNKIGEFWDGTNETYDIFGDNDCIGYETNCVNRVYSQLFISNDLMFDGSENNIVADNHTTRYIINGVNEIQGKSFYQIMNDPSADENCKFNIGLTDIVILKDTIFATGDSNGLTTVGGHATCMNDQWGLAKFIIGKSGTNTAGWPTNPYGTHYHQNYRLWLR